MSNHKSAQGSIEDKLIQIIKALATDADNIHQASLRGHSVATTPLSEHVKTLLAIITTETTRARINELGWAVGYAQSDLGADFVDKGYARLNRLKALQKDQQ